MKVIVLWGPNLNVIHKRDPKMYGKLGMKEILERMQKRAKELGMELVSYQSNHEGALIDFIQANADDATGIIINPGALDHYGYTLRDTFDGVRCPVILVHLSNVYTREEWRRRSVLAEGVKGQIVGCGWFGFIAALEVIHTLASETKG